MNETVPVRVLFTSDTAGHTAGYHVVARGLRDAGFDVILTGRQLPTESARAALQEGVDLVAVRIMDRDPIEYVGSLLEALRENRIGDVPVLVGGIIGKRDADKLRDMGVVGVFRPGSKLTAITECARNAVAARSASVRTDT